MSTANEELIEQSLYRLTHGIPKRELKLMISEADQIEKDLQRDIQTLQAALDGKEHDEEAASKIMDSLLTPVEQSWTAPALIGRLRGELAVPSILGTKEGSSPIPPSTIKEKPTAMIELAKNPLYEREHPNSTDLLACWKKIFGSKDAFVFKKAVKPEEAPGYTDRIKFPMDLGLLRKMIVARKVKSYADLHQHVALISHNCVKYNGRDTDYGVVARNFEAMADDAIFQAVHQRSSPTTGRDSAMSTASGVTATSPVGGEPAAVKSGPDAAKSSGNKATKS